MRKANDITKWENVKGRIFLHLVNYERYKAELADMAYVPFLDLAILFYCDLEEYGLGGFYVKKEHLLIWKQDSDSLLQAAQGNTFHETNVQVTSITEEPISGRTPKDDEKEDLDLSQMISITNKHNSYGAAMVLNVPVLKKLTDLLGSDLYLLPSSVHEFFAIRTNPAINIRLLMGVVKSVNEGLPRSELYLSDSVYYYDREKCEVRIAVPT